MSPFTAGFAIQIHATCHEILYNIMYAKLYAVKYRNRFELERFSEINFRPLETKLHFKNELLTTIANQTTPVLYFTIYFDDDILIKWARTASLAKKNLKRIYP